MGLTVTDRFLKYVTFDTKSSEETGTTPSTPGQRVFAEALVNELEALGLEDISIDEHSYVMATLPANTDSEETPVIGFIAHLDTSPDMSGKDVNPRIVSYQGGDIILNKDTLKDLIYNDDYILKSSQKDIIAQYALLNDEKVYKENFDVMGYGNVELFVKRYEKEEINDATNNYRRWNNTVGSRR